MNQMTLKKGLVWIAAAVIALTVGAFASTTQAYAEDQAPINPAASVAITKDFQMPTNVTCPAATFTYKVTPTKVNELDWVEDHDGGKIADQEISYLAGNASATTSHIGEVHNMFDKVTFKHGGEYVYLITENLGNAEGVDYNVNSNAYYMHVYVENDSLAITSVGTYKATTTDGGKTWTQGEKIDGSTPTVVDGKITEHGQMIFTNTYPNKTQEFDIKKVVAGKYADKTKQFSFTSLTIQTPSMVGTSKKSYTGTIFNADGTATTTTVALSQDGTDLHKYVATAAFTLSDGQYVRFYNEGENLNQLPVGTTYTFAETGTANYTPSGTVQTNNEAKSDLVKEGSGAFGAGDSIDVKASTASNKNVIGEAKANEVVITNTYKEVTPTGILIDNLPWILLVCAAGAGLVVFVVSRRNKKVHVA